MNPLSVSGGNIANSQFLFSTPFRISSQDQQDIIGDTLQTGSVVPIAEGFNAEPFWVSQGLTYVPESLISHVPKELHGRWTYLNRMNSELSWTWTDSDSAKIVKRVLEPLRPYFKCVTRVTVLVQRPHVPLSAHRDLVPFNEYENLLEASKTFWGDKRLRYEGDPWFKNFQTRHDCDLHRRQEFMNLKIPLSSRPGTPGRPYIQSPREKLYYDSEDHIFFLNEAEVEHGADAVEFHRGVVIVDGLFDETRFPELRRLPVRAGLKADSASRI